MRFSPPRQQAGGQPGRFPQRSLPLHRPQNEFLGFIHALEDDLQIHRWFVGLADAGAVDAVLAYQDEGVRQEVRGHGEFPSRGAHLKFVTFQLLLIHVFLSILEG